MLVEEVKLLSRYLKAREQLEMELGGREPTREEWASSLGISTEELARQMVVSARAQVGVRMCLCVGMSVCPCLCAYAFDRIRGLECRGCV